MHLSPVSFQTLMGHLEGLAAGSRFCRFGAPHGHFSHTACGMPVGSVLTLSLAGVWRHNSIFAHASCFARNWQWQWQWQCGFMEAGEVGVLMQQLQWSLISHKKPWMEIPKALVSNQMTFPTLRMIPFHTCYNDKGARGFQMYTRLL